MCVPLDWRVAMVMTPVWLLSSGDPKTVTSLSGVEMVGGRLLPPDEAMPCAPAGEGVRRPTKLADEGGKRGGGGRRSSTSRCSGSVSARP